MKSYINNVLLSFDIILQNFTFWMINADLDI